ncbi:hypothetical protein HK101_007233 [Irineochytrium annulatum]|nr:hypothetical protein HK101_007233 [Irineochytrium annulatum]
MEHLDSIVEHEADHSLLDYSCAAITTALIVISFTASSFNNDLSLASGEASIQTLALEIQTKVSITISLQIAAMAAAPVALLGNLVKLINLQYLDPLNSDQLYPYLYQQILDFNVASYLYFGSAVSGNFVAVGKSNYAPPWRYQALIEDNLQNVPNGTACPKLCPQNMDPGIISIWDVDASGNFNKSSHPQTQPFPTRERPWYVPVAKQPVSVPMWTPVYVYSDAVHNIGMTTSQAIYSTSGTIVGVAAVDITFGVLSTNLRQLPLTPHGFAFAFNDQRILFGSSVANETISIAGYDSTGAQTNNLKYINQMTDLNSIIAVAAILAACNQTLSHLAPNGTYQTSGLIFQHVSFSDPYGLKLFVVNGAPLTDYTGLVDEARATLKSNLTRSEVVMIVVAVFLCLFFVGLSIPATFVLIGRPLTRLANHMEEASRFDFTSLHAVDRNARSTIKELSTIENAYWNMIAKFAEGVSKNKQIALRGAQQSSVMQSSHDMSFAKASVGSPPLTADAPTVRTSGEESHPETVPSGSRRAMSKNGDQSEAASTLVTENKGLKLPFFSIVTAELFICCAAITAALIAISFTTSSSNNDLCLETGESAIQTLALTIQSKVSTTISLQIATIAAAPVSMLGNLVKLINLGYYNPQNIDQMYPYLYQQIVGFDEASYVYFGAESTGNFVCVGKANFAPPWQYQALIERNDDASCPKVCPTVMPKGNLAIWNIDANGNFNKSATPSTTAYPTKQRPWYTQAAGVTVPVWTPVYVYDDIGHNVGITTQTLKVPHQSQAIYVNGNLLGVAAVDITFGVLSTNLRNLPLTPNGFAFAFNNKQSTGALTNDLKYLANMTDPNSIIAVQAILEACKGNLTNLPASETYQKSGLIFQHSSFSDPYGLNMYVVNGAPLTDYTGSVEETRSTLKSNLNHSEMVMIIIAVSLCVFFVGMSVPATFILIAKPLNRLAQHMEQASKFDFSALHGVNRNARSTIKELSVIENAYWNMISKFADGIQKNKALVQRHGHGPNSNGNQSTNDVSGGGKSSMMITKVD